MNRRKKARGYRSGVSETTGDLSVERKIVPEMYWRDVYRRGEIIQIYYSEARDGRRFQVKDVKVTEVAISDSESGDSSLKISFMALDHFEVPAGV
jgi:hypothetical protein